MRILSIRSVRSFALISADSKFYSIYQPQIEHSLKLMPCMLLLSGFKYCCAFGVPSADNVENMSPPSAASSLQLRISLRDVKYSIPYTLGCPTFQ
jgi:hypothetical protein